VIVDPDHALRVLTGLVGDHRERAVAGQPRLIGVEDRELAVTRGLIGRPGLDPVGGQQVRRHAAVLAREQHVLARQPECQSDLQTTGDMARAHALTPVAAEHDHRRRLARSTR
jgi:hypothetical protein